MGVCTQGDIQIVLQTVEDADYVYDQLEKIAELTEERLKTPCHFNLEDNHVDGKVFYCNVYSDRIQNGEFQIKQVIEQLKIMVKKNHIRPPESLIAELLVQEYAWSMEDDDFKE